MSRKIKPRITDADASPLKVLDAESIAADVERFLAGGGAIERPAFRRDYLRSFNNKQQGIRRAWVTTPPDLKPNLRGQTRER